MDKDRIKGKLNDMKGRVERQVGEWTGDEDAQAKGTADQVKGKVQNAVGKAKDAGREMADKVKDRNRGDKEIHDEEDLDERAA